MAVNPGILCDGLHPEGLPAPAPTSGSAKAALRGRACVGLWERQTGLQSGKCTGGELGQAGGVESGAAGTPRAMGLHTRTRSSREPSRGESWLRVQVPISVGKFYNIALSQNSTSIYVEATSNLTKMDIDH